MDAGPAKLCEGDNLVFYLVARGKLPLRSEAEHCDRSTLKGVSKKATFVPAEQTREGNHGN